MIRKRNNITCKSCGKLFYCPPSRLRRGGKYCSSTCDGLSRKTGVIKKCEICQKKFYRSKSRSQNSKIRFCSNACKVEASKKNVVRECLNCFLEFTSSYWRYRKYCSRKCMLSRKGLLSPNWQGGKTKLQTLIRHSSFYKEWRKLIFERDDYTCQTCGIKSKKGKHIILEADHIIPFYLLLKKNNIQNIADTKNCTELWDTNNGRTLCKKCHKETETYGWKARWNYAYVRFF